MNRTSRIAAAVFMFMAGAQVLHAQTPEERGLEIATERDQRDSGFGDFSADLEMHLMNRQGEESTRVIESRTLEVPGDGDKTLVIFESPADIKGTALLSFTHKQGSDDQWLYLPALKRVKRIASDNKSGPFMGSEFAYEDIASQEVEKYTYRYVEDAVYNGMDCFVVDYIPVDPKSGYTKQVSWIDKEHYRFQKIDYYDRKDSLLKTLTFSGYKQYMDRYWRADEMYMENHQTGKSTRLIWKNYHFANGYTDGDFDKTALKRSR